MSGDDFTHSGDAIRRHNRSIDDLMAKRRRSIEKIADTCSRALSDALKKGEVSESEVKLAEDALLFLSVGRRDAERIRIALQSLDLELSYQFDIVLAFMMRGVFISGGLVISSKTIRANRTRGALNTMEGVRDLHLEAIRYTLAQPPKRPLGKARGPYAIASKALDAANQWLKDNGHAPDLTVGKIKNRLVRNPEYFQPSDGWLK